MPVLSIKDIEAREMIPGFVARMVHMEGMTFSQWEIKAGAQLPEHHHIHEQLSYLVQGEFDFTLEGKTERITPGKLVVIPSNTVHSGKAITDCVIVDIFQPVREDYK
ncbi:cupin domain-containing protein [Spongiivirga sp. MCCC 1A20706]|uniref:cupin domain-containing protein n=1 Tax=Spongiivirga sp. MCCC 1A20706 TaxID=3160963 RepID=UPI0039773E9D